MKTLRLVVVLGAVWIVSVAFGPSIGGATIGTPNVVSVAFGPSARAAAIGTPNCEFCSYSGHLDGHYFAGSSCATGGGCKDCDDDPAGHIGCHAATKPGECSTHGLCSEEEPCEGCEEAVLAAAADEDADAVVNLIRAHPDRVELGDRRRAVFMRNCKGAIESYLPLSDELWAEVAASLTALPQSR